MTDNLQGYFLFVGGADSEAATTRLRASGAIYRKKLLNSRPENWRQIVELILASKNRGTLVVFSGHTYEQICSQQYSDVALQLLDALIGRHHVIFVHEAVFLTEEQRAAAGGEQSDRASFVDVTPRFTDEDYFGMAREDFFGEVSNDLRQRVNGMLQQRGLNVLPYKTNVERSLMASAFLDEHERNMLFRVYVPHGRLYAQEADTLLGLFREWLGQMGRRGVRQEGYSTSAGQVFEFFISDDEGGQGLARDFEDFSSFLSTCVNSPEDAEAVLQSDGVDEDAARRIVSRFSTQARRLSLDLRQRREERLLSLKHRFESVMLEIDGLDGLALEEALETLLPSPGVGSVLGINGVEMPINVTNYNPQFISQVAAPIVQNISGTVNLSAEAQDILRLVAKHGGEDRGTLETAVYELEDIGARGNDRIVARSRIKKFLVDLGNRGVGVGLNVLQKYIEQKIGLV